jgi:C1A family cysteine protease
LSDVGSPLQLYYDERKDQGDTAHDTGASIREIMKALANYGLAPESDWPYDITQFTTAPPAQAISDALQHKAQTYLAVAVDVNQINQALYACYPVIIGITVYANFESNAAGDVPMPSGQVLGGHAICLAGYDDARQRFHFRNSWGTAFGNAGYGTLPYAYVGNSRLGSDYWTLELVTTPPPAPVPTPGPATQTATIRVFSDGTVTLTHP